MNWMNQLVVCCDCNRPTLDTIRAAGFGVTSLTDTTLPKVLAFVRPAIVGSATALPRAPRSVQSETSHKSTASR
jgi:hypothetical protein